MIRHKFFLLFLLGCTIAELPPFIKPCSKSSPWLQFCVMHQIPMVMRALKVGYPQFGFRPIDPFVIEDLEVPVANYFYLAIKNMQIRGLSKAKFDFIKVDPYKNVLEMRVRFPQINIQGFYRMKGPLFFVDIDTHGPAALTFVDLIMELRVELKVIERNGQRYYEMPNRPIPGRDMDLEISKANMYLGNLVPDDAKLNDKLNYLIRETFFPVFDSIKPGLVSLMWQVAQIIASPLLAYTSVDEMFVP